MLKHTLLSLMGVALFSLPAIAQDDDAPDVHVEKKGVVIVEEHDDDGEGESKVIILQGDDLDGFDFDLDMDMDMDEKGLKKLKKRMAKFKLRSGDETMEFDYDFSGDGKGFEKNLKKMMKKQLKHLDGIEGMEGMEDLFDPEKRGAWIEKIKSRAKAQKKKSQEARAKRTRDDAIASLKIGDEETAAVIIPLLDAVLETQRRVDREDKARRKGLRKGPQDEAALRPKLDALRAAGKKDAQDLAKAREELRGILTLEQEIELVLRGILD